MAEKSIPEIRKEVAETSLSIDELRHITKICGLKEINYDNIILLKYAIWAGKQNTTAKKNHLFTKPDIFPAETIIGFPGSQSEAE